MEEGCASPSPKWRCVGSKDSAEQASDSHVGGAHRPPVADFGTDPVFYGRDFASSKIVEAHEMHPTEVIGNFLVVPDVLPTAYCEQVLETLLRLHRPQELVYHGNGKGGTSYTNSWRISTYCHTSPTTYVYQVFKEQYGVPYNVELRNYVESCGLMQIVEGLKAQFLSIHHKSLGAEQVAKKIADMKLSQQFLTVQLSKTRMQELDTYMQPHYDPSSLTINLHLSKLDFRGCDPNENGLRVFHASQSTVYRTDQGAATFIWEDKDGSSCLHTANDITAGERVVLCCFFRENLEQVVEPEQDELPQRVHASLAVNPIAIPVQFDAQQCLNTVPPEARKLFDKQEVVSLSLQPLLCAGAAGFSHLENLVRECKALESMMHWDGHEGFVDILSRTADLPGARTEAGVFRKLRNSLGSQACARETHTSQLLLEQLPALLQQVVSGAGHEELLFYNEIFAVVRPGQTDNDDRWRMEHDDLSMCLMGVEIPTFYTIWMPLNKNHMINVVMKRNADEHAVPIRLKPGEAVVLSSTVRYCHESSWDRDESPLLLWCVQFSKSSITASREGPPIAFAVPCQITSSDSHIVTEDSAEGGKCDLSKKRVLSRSNGVCLYQSEEKLGDEDGIFFPLHRAGDCFLVKGRTWHKSIPSEPDCMLLKLVVFFSFPPTLVGDRHTCNSWESRGFILDCDELLRACFGEVMCEWDSYEHLPPSNVELWTPYNDYKRNNGQQSAGWRMDQLQSVRRVMNHQLTPFMASQCMQNTSDLLGIVRDKVRAETTCFDLDIYDLHFLRQTGANAASFSCHLDIQDTGDPSTTIIEGGCSVLLGGWQVHGQGSRGQVCICENGVGGPGDNGAGSDPPILDEATVGSVQAKDVDDNNISLWLPYFDSDADIATVQAAVWDVKLIFAMPPAQHSDDGDTATYTGCKCPGGVCSPESCLCMKIGTVQAATDESRDIHVSLFECSPACTCGSDCANRATQQQHYPPLHRLLEVFSAGAGKGWGVRARERITKGQLVVQYLGEAISYEEACQRRKSHESKGDGGMTYLIVVKETVTKTGRVIRTCIDARSVGNVARFINHSCDPNLVSLCVRVSTPIPRLVMFARRDISAGEELTISYGGGAPPAGKEGRASTGSNRVCMCGSLNCSGYMPFDDD